MASILRHGRLSDNQRLSLAFNYLAETNAVWGAPELQQRFNYEAVFPDQGSAGVRIVFSGELTQ